MNPNTLKEELNNDLHCDTLLAKCQNCHLRESINDHKFIVITMLG
jgi:hypothetical protein